MKDGISRLLSKSDLDKLKSSTNRAQVLKAEEILSDAWKILQHCQNKSVLTLSFGRLLVRCVLYLTGKEKAGREGKSYKDLSSICDLFTADVSGQTSATTSMGTASSSKAGDQPANLLTLSIGEQALIQNKHLKLQEKHLGWDVVVLLLSVLFFSKLDCLQCTTMRYVHHDHPDKIFIFHGLVGACGKFIHQGLFGGEDISSSSVDDFKKWRLTKAPIPCLCDPTMVAQHSYNQSPLLMEAQKKAEAEQLLFSIYQEHSHDATAFHYCLPMNLYSKDKFAAGKLKLYPLGSLNKVKDSKKANLLVEYAGRQYSLSPFSYLKDFSEFLGLP